MKPSKQRRALTLGAVGSILGAGVGLVPAMTAHADVPTMSSGNLRDGWDADEPGLTPANVASSFGQIFATQLTNADGTPDHGHIFAEPTIVNGTLIVATESNNVYGLDPVTGTVKWRRNVGPAWPGSTIGCNDLTPTVGITGSPVYDPASNALYFTDKTPDARQRAPDWYMHAVDPATGAEKPGFPVRIQGTPTNDPNNTFNAEDRNAAARPAAAERRRLRGLRRPLRPTAARTAATSSASRPGPPAISTMCRPAAGHHRWDGAGIWQPAAAA